MQLNTTIGCFPQSIACKSTGINLHMLRKNKSIIKYEKPEWVSVSGGE